MINVQKLIQVKDIDHLEKILRTSSALPTLNPKYLEFLAFYFSFDLIHILIYGKNYHIYSPLFIVRSRNTSFLKFLRYGNTSPYGLGGYVLLIKDTPEKFLNLKNVNKGLSKLIKFILFEKKLYHIKMKIHSYPFGYTNDLLNCIPRERNIFFHIDYVSDYIMRVNDINEAWKLFGKKSRNIVRKAEKYGFRFRIGTKKDISIFYKLWKTEVQKRYGIKVAVTPSFFYGLFEKIHGQTLLTVVEDDSGFIGGALTLTWNNSMTFLAWTTKMESQRYGSKTYLIWKTIEYALLNQKVKIINYGESFRGSGSALFKKHMGGNEYTVLKIQVFKKPFNILFQILHKSKVVFRWKRKTQTLSKKVIN